MPGADPRDLELTVQRLNWWRARHPEQADRVPRIIASWPDERAIVMTRESGAPLGRHLRWSPMRRLFRAQERLDRFGCAFGAWLRSFAAGRPPYDDSIHPMLGQRSSLSVDGRLTVDARRLLANRIEQGHRAAHTLDRAGVRFTRNWSARFSLDSIERSVSEKEPAGFVHGDVKPDNVLVGRNGFSLIDWWVTPRVSWPLTDLANFAGNLRLGGGSAGATRLWQSLLHGYFENGPDDQTLATIDLVSFILCLTHSATSVQNKMSRFALVRRGRRFLADLSARHRPMALGAGLREGLSL
ncbi:MAG: phosphotransferase [Planctomycetes bacterium]|nr:phosphotransferase [Planctomycetota bacterium]